MSWHRLFGHDGIREELRARVMNDDLSPRRRAPERADSRLSGLSPPNPYYKQLFKFHDLRKRSKIRKIRKTRGGTWLHPHGKLNRLLWARIQGTVFVPAPDREKLTGNFPSGCRREAGLQPSVCTATGCVVPPYDQIGIPRRSSSARVFLCIKEEPQRRNENSGKRRSLYASRGLML